MALLSNINDKFAVDSTGAIQFNGQVGTSGYILKSNANAAPTWVDPSTVIGGPYLPLTGGTLTGATATASGISFTVGGTLTGTSATFSGTISAVGASTFNLGEGIFTKAVNTSSAIASSNVWGYGLYEGVSRIGEFSMVRDGSSSVYIGTSFAGQKLILGTAAKVPALTLDASQNATFAGTVQVNGSNVTVIKNSDPALTVSDTDTNYRGSMRWLSSSNVLEFFTRYAGTYYTNNLVLDRGNVGIGTNSLGEKLVIRETSNTAATRIKIEGGSYGFTLGKTTQAANYVHLRPGSNSPAVFRIMPNVGPNYSYMEVWGTDFESNTTNYNRLMFYINGSTGDANIKINKAGSSPAGSLYIGTASSEQAITILNSGNVGIGTTPTQPLDVDGYSICDKQFQRDNTLLTILNTPRVLNIGYRGPNGTYTFDPTTLFGSLAQGGQCTLEVTGWRAALNNGIIHWADNGSNTNIGAGQVYYTQTAYKLGGQSGSNLISVSNTSGTNNITITFTGWHSNSHGWNCKIISYQA